MLLKHWAMSFLAYSLAWGTLCQDATGAELQGNWALQITGHPGSGTWSFDDYGSAFSGELRTSTSSFFWSGFDLGTIILGFNTSLTPAGNYNGLALTYIPNNVSMTGLWIDTSGVFFIGGNKLGRVPRSSD